MNNNPRKLSSQQQAELIAGLQIRFEKNMSRHAGLEWNQVRSRLEA